jgi:DnaJ-class molecular chaperone
MTEPTAPPCPRCNGQGCYLQKSPLDPTEVDWDLCILCDGSGVQP